MGIRLPAVMVSVLKGVLAARDHDENKNKVVPRGHIAVYLVPGGEMMMSATHDHDHDHERDDQRRQMMKKKIKRLVVPIWVLNHPCFQGLLKRAEDEFGFNHPMGALTIPYPQQLFLR